MKEYIQVPISCYTWCSFQVFTSVVHPEILTTTWSALATSTDSWWKAQNRISKQRKLSNTNDTTAPVVSITTSRSYSYQDQQLSTRVLELSVYHYRMKLFHLIVAVTLLVSGRTQLQGFDLQSVSLICNKRLFLRHSDSVLPKNHPNSGFLLYRERFASVGFWCIFPQKFWKLEALKCHLKYSRQIFL